MRLLGWIKNHKLSSVFLGIILFYLLQGFFGASTLTSRRSLSLPQLSEDTIYNKYNKNGYAGMEQRVMPPVTSIDTSNQNRLVQKESSLSLLVSDVRSSADTVIKQAESMGGFMIQSNFSNPGESPYGTISVRVPSSGLASYLEILRKQAIRVVSEELSGTDITDQYRDINSRLVTLNTTKKKFEEIYNKAVTVQEILDVQNKINELQDQIDSLKGQQRYLEKSSETSKVTVSLSTDELALPFAPDSSWRPGVVFKAAVRSLVENIRDFASLLIWIGVYSVFWVPVLLVIIFIRRRMRNNRIQR